MILRCSDNARVEIADLRIRKGCNNYLTVTDRDHPPASTRSGHLHYEMLLDCFLSKIEGTDLNLETNRIITTVKATHKNLTQLATNAFSTMTDKSVTIDVLSCKNAYLSVTR